MSLSGHRTSLPRIWEFRRLFYRLYRAGIPIHQTDILRFLSSLGPVDPLIYNIVIYAAARVNDVSIALRLTREYESHTSVALPLDAIAAIFLMYRRLGDTDSLKKVYIEAEGRGLQPLRNSFFVTAVLLFEAYKENTTYWDLCSFYSRFFDKLSLIRLALPLPRDLVTSLAEEGHLEPTSGTLAVMLHSYLKTTAGRVEGSRHALRVYKRYIDILRNNVDKLQLQMGNEHLLAVIVSAVGKYKSNLGLALGIIQDMIDFNYLPDPTSITWDCLLRASIWHMDVNISERIWEAMLEHGIPPTSYTYSAMVILYATVGDREKASILCDRLVNEGWPTAPHVQQAFDIFNDKARPISSDVSNTDNLL
ncbi:hypothetical protein H072_2798 [Dactylellina haptotyla CBS 200.50]|uniref:Pentacotripeptide-repeat region of PRORP domain-containing protein n=1 Tax=Dactylellina haptotyla (strain CBS 200.50) TaxID=1284197 RepID=S8BUR2_DACHA|nr:hypothetical protein H072_2798 [Dactylellina haptotyla CBS 200.50]